MRTRLRGGEEVTAVIRRHWIALAGPFGLALFLLGCLLAAFAVQRPYAAPAAGGALVAAALWAWWRWLVWSRDLWVVTTARVIDESGVLNVRMVDSPLDKIHNVTCEQSLAGRLLGYGTLQIQTAAEAGATVIDRVAGPREAKEAILEGQERYKTALLDRQAAPILAAARAAQGAAGSWAGPPGAAGRGRGGAAGADPGAADPGGAGTVGAGAGGAVPGGAVPGGPGAGGAAAAGMKECPYCAEPVRARATVCRFCGRTI